MADKFKCKTDKKGEFSDSTTKDKPKWAFMVSNIDLTAKLTSPKDTTVEGTLSFNKTKNKFKGKTGQSVTFKKLALEDKNTIALEGSTDPVQPDTELVFEVDYK